MYFDRLDVLDAWYLFLSENHEGQDSLKYLRLCRMLEYYRPGLLLSYKSLSENARAIYDQL